jgi:PIN domain nuclease of toxin-antitoxin system
VSSVVADTHAIVWYLSGSDRLSAPALAALEDAIQACDTIYLAAISLVEIIYLTEKGRLPEGALRRLENALTAADSGLTMYPLDQAVAWSVRRISRDRIPDMPDRIIAATALTLGLPLITRDAAIRAAGVETVW